MNAELRKILLRSIRGTLGRFLAILAIVALGVGFYAGLKSSQPDMLRSADDYMRRQRMYDFQLMSSLGLSRSDPDAFRRLPGIAAAEGACFADAYARVDGGEEEVWHFQTLTRQVAVPELLSGRMPERSNECLADSVVFGEADLGKHILLTDSNSEDTLDHFSGTEYTIVGLARSPRYISQDRGSSELGAGKPSGFLLLPESGFRDEVYHELLLWCDLPGEIYSEEYSDALRHLRPSVETLLNRRGVLRSEQLRLENSEELLRARQELDDGWSEYRLGLQESARELSDARQQLETAQYQLDLGKVTLTESEKTIAAQRAELSVQKVELSEKKADLEDLVSEQQASLISLLEKEASVATIQAELGIARAASQIDPDLITPIDPDRLSVPGVDLSGLGLDEAALSEILDGVNSAIRSIQEAMENTQADPARVAELEQNLATGNSELDNLQREIETRAEQIMSLTAEVTSLDVTISMTENLLSDMSREMTDSREELAEGETQLLAGWAEYYAGKDRADKELAEARQKLEDAEKELADGEAELVAALVCITTMTRMVNEERTQIGTLKAMGYSAPVIMSKYLLYAGISALLGCVLGFFLGSTGLPYIVWYAYNIMYQYEDLLFHFSPWMLAACLLVSVVGSLLVTWTACRAALSEKPAELIRPKAPAVGRRVLLERIGPLWRHLPFLSKVSIRNAFRYPSRVFMMLLGIGGCTALMVAGFGAKDSLAGVGGFQYDEISLYDVVVHLDPDAVSAHPEALWTDWAEHSALAHREEIRLLNGATGKDTDLILADAAEITSLLSLHTKSGTEISWPAAGEVVITKKLSDALDLRAGDTAVLRLESGRERNVTIAGVCEYYVGHAVFASPDGYPDTDRNYALIHANAGEDIGLRAAQLRGEDGVNYVSLTQTERETLENSMASIDLLVLMLVFCSGALAFITLYNLTNINIMERIREVATVKVLGFTPHETSQYILNENLMLSFLGAGFGLLLGTT